jgi:hypothetical protein
MNVGPAFVSVFDDTTAVKGSAFSGGAQQGRARVATVALPDGALLEVGLVQWENGESDVRTFAHHGGPDVYERLVKGVRLGVHPLEQGSWSCELSILQHHPDRQATAVKASWRDLDAALEGDAEALLLSCGALETGTKADVLGQQDRRSGYLVMTFDPGDVLPAFVAYVIVRVLPIFRERQRHAPIPVGLA